MGCPFLLQGNLLDPGIEAMSPALAGGFFTTMPPVYFLPLQAYVKFPLWIDFGLHKIPLCIVSDNNMIFLFELTDMVNYTNGFSDVEVILYFFNKSPFIDSIDLLFLYITEFDLPVFC